MKKILVVDDEAEVRSVMKILLELKGYDVLTVPNGREAMEKLKTVKVDIVLLDAMMPEMDGFEVCRRIKSDEQFRGIPVVMITALTSKPDRIKGIEAGADDFISKPVDQLEVLARVKMLLKMKESSDHLSYAYDAINSLTSYGEETVKSFNPLDFDFITKIDGIVGQIIRKTSDAQQMPQMVIVGYANLDNSWHWYNYESVFKELNRTVMNMDIHKNLPHLKKGESRSGFVNKSDFDKSEISAFIKRLTEYKITAANVVYYLSDGLCIFAINYGRDVVSYDASVIKNFVVQSLFLQSISAQVNTMLEASAYTVYALARASDINDEATGKHIMRVGEYCSIIAKELKMPDPFIWTIRIQASLHDVGKLRNPSSILKKPGKLTTEEQDKLNKHTIYGAEIIGDHPTLKIARAIALTHHEKWDGSGYPHGLKGEDIPIEGRIFAIADQYDVLETRRTHKAGFNHEEAYRIITQGDGRTMPKHFDPRVLKIFRDHGAKFAQIYERLVG